jgi:hypothetical protein
LKYTRELHNINDLRSKVREHLVSFDRTPWTKQFIDNAS